MGENRFPRPSLSLDMGAAIKGKKSIASMRATRSTAAAAAKIDASQKAERIRACAAIIEPSTRTTRPCSPTAWRCARRRNRRPAQPGRGAHRRTRTTRSRSPGTGTRAHPAGRNRSHRTRTPGREAGRMPVGRTVEPVQQSELPVEAGATATGLGRLENREGPAKPPASSNATIKLGDINARIAPLSISADGIAQLGFRPVSTTGAAKLYPAAFRWHLPGDGAGAPARDGGQEVV